MKSTELMIGDWVEVILNSEKHFARVQTIDGYGDNATSNECVCDAIYYSIDELKPISLTPEILEKNGFEYDHSFHTWIYDEFTINHGYLIEEVYNEHLFVWVADVHVAITYVHELQHILRLCGMNELADNFKI